ncbi:LOW QUALITY PROTEIN: galactose-3-O-sulfotransferase 2 [Sphaerodactylus townsendi]|uniref:LOW QUALITY PROTEIN: galactose-3-O-sulfotransferase 2 n=1 Tax=Sphaerodactylus townsendi TaxID=933632 RepID=UPI00202674CE|nr:LOW QUALITY PROTEIN: galactose-3-O-sulfotransferase 2 [Sphaerodactylus townsendi]
MKEHTSITGREYLGLQVVLKKIMCLSFWLGFVFLAGFLQMDEKLIKLWPTFTQDITHCLPTTNVMYLKTHKTASSTVLNILFNFSEKHNLTVALAHAPHVNLGYPSLFKTAFVEEFKTIGQNFNIMGNHLRFNLPRVRKVMPKDTFYFTILRDPILSLESSYVYYKNYSPAFKNSSNVNEFLSSPWTYYDLNVKIYNIHARNNMWFDFGYDNNAEDDDYYVQSIIQNIEQNFHLILIANYFDESMILLQNTLCWDLDGVVYFKLNTRSLESVQTLTPEGHSPLTSQEKVKDWCALDWKLYKHFNNTFWIKIHNMMSLPSLYQEVKLLQKRQQELMETCLFEKTAVDKSKIKDKTLKPYQSGVANILGYNLKQDLDNMTIKICRRMIMPEVQYVSHLYRQQFPHKTGKPTD